MNNNYIKVENICTFKRIKRLPIEVRGFILDEKIWDLVYDEVDHTIKVGDFVLKASLDYRLDDSGFFNQDEKIFFVQTLEDVGQGLLHRANLNDWLIRGVQGEIYACKPDIFEQTYEVIDE